MTRSVTASEAVRSSTAESWADRKDAVGVLADLYEDASARRRLVELLDDENLAVGEAAATALVVRGGVDGLRRIAGAFDGLDDQTGSYVAVAVSEAADFNLGDAVAGLSSDVDLDVRRGAQEIAKALGLRPSAD